MTLQPCPNCLAALEPDEGRCPICWAFADGRSGALTLFDDAARGEIRDFGGVCDIFVSVPGARTWCGARTDYFGSTQDAGSSGARRHSESSREWACEKASSS